MSYVKQFFHSSAHHPATATRQLRQPKLPLQVVEDVILTHAHGVGVSGEHCQVIEVKPVVLGGECGVVSRASHLVTNMPYNLQ